MDNIKKRNKKINYNKSVTVRLTPESRMMLEEISREEKLKITELVRDAVREYIINKLGA